VGRLRTGVVEQFLAGTLGEQDGTSSQRFVELLVRSFVRGSPSVPWDGTQAIADQLAPGLPAGTVRLGVRLDGVPSAPDGGRRAVSVAGQVSAKVVVVAADPTTAAGLTGLPAPRMHPLTTFWHVAPRAPTPTALLHLDADRRGPLGQQRRLSSSATQRPPTLPTLRAAGRSSPPRCWGPTARST